MASLQARHSRSCALGRPWTTFVDATKSKGCTCTPLYHVVLRHGGQLVREPVGHNRKEAERALDATRGDVARRKYRVLEDLPFDEWADRWLAGFTGKENSRRVYATTVAAAKHAFGRTNVRDLDARDIRRLLDHIRDEHARRQRPPAGQEPKPIAPATLAKHLRQIGACLEAAVLEGYAAENPVKRLHRTARPRVGRSLPAYFTDDELRRLWPALGEPIYATLCRLAAATGLRLGELAALEWEDIDLLNRELHVRKTYTEGVGVTAPKSGEARTVDLTPQAARILEDWFPHTSGVGLVFQPGGAFLSGDHVRKQVLYPAMRQAGIPRVGERGRKRDFHSLRHSFARIALEHGAEITWVQRQLGHSSITLTVDTYGRWARAAEKAQAAKLAAAFPL